MNRRNFLTGIIAAAASGEALVRLAKPEEMAQLTVGDTALLSPDKAFFLPGSGAALDGNVYVKRIDGTYQWFGRVLDVSMGNTGNGWIETKTQWELLPTTDDFIEGSRKEWPFDYREKRRGKL